jgi:hypothetical protein
MELGIPLALIVSLVTSLFADVPSAAARREKIHVSSSIDGTEQPCYLMLPEGFRPEGPPLPLLVSLHTWSGDVGQRDQKMEEEALGRGWIYLWPHFRGPNQTPEACGSERPSRISSMPRIGSSSITRSTERGST